MKQDPEYLRNRSRRAYAANRKQRNFANKFPFILATSFGGIMLSNHIRGVDTDYKDIEMWLFVGFVIFTGLFWAFYRAIVKLHFKFVQNTYGPEPEE